MLKSIYKSIKYISTILFLIPYMFFGQSLGDDDFRVSSSERKTILILDLVDESKGKSYTALSTSLSDVIKNSLLRKDKYQFVSKRKVQKIIRQMKLSKSVLKSKSNAIKIAKRVSASVVIFGYYRVEKSKINLSLQVVDVKREKLVGQHQNKTDTGKESFTTIDTFVDNEYKEINRILGIQEKETEIEEVNNSNDKLKNQIGIKIGYPIIFGVLGDKSIFDHLYLGLMYRPDLFESNILFLELEVGIFGFRSEEDYLNRIISKAFPISISSVFEIELNEKILFIPKLGLGYMILSQSYNNDNYSSYFIFFKPSIAILFQIFDNLLINLETSLITSYNLEAGFDELSYFLIPSLGVSYQF